MPYKKVDYIFMDFYGIIEKVEFKGLIKEAKKSCLNSALERLKNFDPMNEVFYQEMMPESTPKSLVKKRTNKLLLMKQTKELKRLLG